MKLIQLKNLEQETKAVSEAEKNEIEFEDKTPAELLPELILKKVKRKIRDGAKDYKKDWDNAIDLVDWSLQELNISKPLASNPRWSQYLDLIQEAVKELHKARGENFKWILGV